MARENVTPDIKNLSSQELVDLAKKSLHGLDGYKKNPELVYQCSKLAAEQGNSDGIGLLGECYDKGIGVAENVEEAVNCYQKAAEMGNRRAMFCLGLCFYEGRGVPRSTTEALNCFHLAVPDPNACYYLGIFHMCGEGLGVDSSSAVMYYRMAAEQNHTRAMVALASCYEYGGGVEQSKQIAAEYYLKAAKLGDPVAQSRIYSVREWLSLTHDDGVKYLQMAVEQGHQEAIHHLNAIKALYREMEQK